MLGRILTSSLWHDILLLLLILREIAGITDATIPTENPYEIALKTSFLLAPLPAILSACLQSLNLRDFLQ
jgi:hypothetical protein